MNEAAAAYAQKAQRLVVMLPTILQTFNTSKSGTDMHEQLAVLLSASSAAFRHLLPLQQDLSLVRSIYKWDWEELAQLLIHIFIGTTAMCTTNSLLLALQLGFP